MLYEQYTIGGELMHSAKGVEWKNKKYIDKIKTKTGKWRYIYDKKITGKSNRERRNNLIDKYISEGNKYATFSTNRIENQDRHDELQKQRKSEINRLDDEYEKTVAGKIENVKEKASNVKNDAVIKIKSNDLIYDIMSNIEKKKKKKKK